MKKYVALLRGINVGGNNKIKMSELKNCFESIGYSNVATYINSGNVIFETRKRDTKKITTEIEKAINNKFKLTISVILRNQKNIESICKKIPAKWINDKENKTDVMFLSDKFANKNVMNQVSFNSNVDSLLYASGAIIWHLKKKDYGKSKMNDIIGTDIYKNMTVRNVNTVNKLNDLLMS